MEPQDTSTTPTPKPLDENAFPQASASGSGSSLVPLLLAISALVGVAIAAWYFMRPAAMPAEMMMPVPDAGVPVVETEVSAAASDPVVQALSTQGSSDEIADIEADLNATDLNAVEADLQGI